MVGGAAASMSGLSRDCASAVWRNLPSKAPEVEANDNPQLLHTYIPDPIQCSLTCQIKLLLTHFLVFSCILLIPGQVKVPFISVIQNFYVLPIHIPKMPQFFPHFKGNPNKSSSF